MPHTPEPWKFFVCISHEECTFICSDNKGIAFEVNEANARRIISCVNAMAGIDDPEGFVKLAHMHREDSIMWEKHMMELVGEDGPGSVRDVIDSMKRKIAEQDFLLEKAQTLLPNMEFERSKLKFFYVEGNEKPVEVTGIYNQKNF